MPSFQTGSSSDFLSRSSTLRKASEHRVDFDPKNKSHLASLKSFIETGNWGAAHFHAEYPFTDVPMTVLIKFAGMHLKAVREDEQTRAARLATKKLIAVVASESPEQRSERIAASNAMLKEQVEELDRSLKRAAETQGAQISIFPGQ